MLHGNIPVEIGARTEYLTGALILGVEHTLQLEEPVATAARDKNFVEFKMYAVPFLIAMPVVEEPLRTN